MEDLIRFDFCTENELCRIIEWIAQIHLWKHFELDQRAFAQKV